MASVTVAHAEESLCRSSLTQKQHVSCQVKKNTTCNKILTFMPSEEVKWKKLKHFNDYSIINIQFSNNITACKANIFPLLIAFTD